MNVFEEGGNKNANKERINKTRRERISGGIQ